MAKYLIAFQHFDTNQSMTYEVEAESMDLANESVFPEMDDNWYWLFTEEVADLEAALVACSEWSKEDDIPF